MKDVVMFDVDGVILDSFSDQFKWFKKIYELVKQKEFRYTDIEEFREVYEEPVYPNLYETLGFDWKKEKDIIWAEYKKHKSEAKINLFPEITEVIKELYNDRKTLAIVSSNTRASINKHLEENNLKSYFSSMVTAEDLPGFPFNPFLKPHPIGLLMAMDNIGRSSSELIYVGDQPSDVEATRRASKYTLYKIPVVAVSYGFSSKEKLANANPDFLVDSPKELLQVIIKEYN